MNNSEQTDLKKSWYDRKTVQCTYSTKRFTVGYNSLLFKCVHTPIALLHFWILLWARQINNFFKISNKSPISGKN